MKAYCNLPNIKDYPRIGFNFPDITYLLENQNHVFNDIIEYLHLQIKENPPDKILCIESFGYLIGAPLSLLVNRRLVICRKKGNLPRPTVSQTYDMCYDENRIVEINKNSIMPNEKILIVDDFLASGGTSLAAAKLVIKLKGEVYGFGFAFTIDELGGEKKLDFNCKLFNAMNIKFEFNKWNVIKNNMTC